jgi:uncharacterized protein (TIGR03086 family)
VEEDPLAAFRAARADIEAVLADPGQAGTEFDWFTGRITVQQHIDQVASSDMPLHGWDLARATGQDDTIDPVEVQGGLSMEGTMPEEVLRQPGVLGPIVPVPADASPQDRLLGYLGRDPGWTPTAAS